MTTCPVRRSSMEPSRRRSRRADCARGEGPVARGRLERGVSRPEAGGDGRPAVQGQLVDERDGAEQRARRQHHGDRDQPAREQPAPAKRAAPEPAAGDPEAREHRRGEQRDRPRIRSLERWQERLRAASDQLRDDARDRGDQEQDRREPEPRGGRKGPVASRHGWPPHRHERDQDRTDGCQADGEVDRSARAVADQHQAEHDEPQDHEDDGQDSQLDGSHAHGRSLPMGARCAASTRSDRTHGSSRAGTIEPHSQRTAPRCSARHRTLDGRDGPSLLPPRPNPFRRSDAVPPPGVASAFPCPLRAGRGARYHPRP